MSMHERRIARSADLAAAIPGRPNWPPASFATPPGLVDARHSLAGSMVRPVRPGRRAHRPLLAVGKPAAAFSRTHQKSLSRMWTASLCTAHPSRSAAPARMTCVDTHDGTGPATPSMRRLLTGPS
ncbi:hypothetical protein MRX96_021604 [Rhipicephalus microplus]